MIELNKPYKDYRLYYQIHHDSNNTLYERSRYHIYTPLGSYKQQGEFALLYNTLSGEIMILSEDEDRWWNATAQLIDITSIESQEQRDFVNTLICHDLLVPASTDMAQVLHDGRAAARADFDRKCSLIEGYFSYVIFTTTECNARCFYCFEKGAAQIRMTQQTTMEVARFIEHNYRINQQEVTLNWFGGEPLYNIAAIDTISDYLNANGVPFSSTIISNAYLFTPDVQQRAIDSWHLRYIQITLDGLEANYNRSKNYIYPKDSGVSPYQRVMSNIMSADEKGINVHIRINVDLHNIDELRQLVDEIAQRIGNRKTNMFIYSYALFDIAPHMHGKNRDTRISQARKQLDDHLRSLGLGKAMRPPQHKVNNCMADSPHSVTIHPDGTLGKCEHYSDRQHAFSDLRGTFHDQAMYDSYFKPIPRNATCDACPVLPQCMHLQMCASAKPCDELLISSISHDERSQLLSLYHQYRQDGKQLPQVQPTIVSGMKINDIAAMQAESPAIIWPYTHSRYAATLPVGTWAAHFVYTFDMGSHQIHDLRIDRIDHRTKHRTLLTADESRDLRTSLCAICHAYLREHPDNVLAMRQTAAQQRLAAHWHADFCAQHPDCVTLLQPTTTDKDGNTIHLSILVSTRCNNYDNVCQALASQAQYII